LLQAYLVLVVVLATNYLLPRDFCRIQKATILLLSLTFKSVETVFIIIIINIYLFHSHNAVK